jgi:hypothetical protein
MGRTTTANQKLLGERMICAKLSKPIRVTTCSRLGGAVGLTRRAPQLQVLPRAVKCG